MMAEEILSKFSQSSTPYPLGKRFSFARGRFPNLPANMLVVLQTDDIVICRYEVSTASVCMCFVQRTENICQDRPKVLHI